MMIDLTVRITQKLQKESPKFEKMAALGHLGTHFDVMNKEFSTDNFIRKGKLVNVNHIKERDICIEDLQNTNIEKEDFILFHTGFLKQEGYGISNYFTNHPQLSRELIDYLLNKKISLIGIDSAGIRRGSEHTITDQYCADRAYSSSKISII
ncbi:MAG: cyclase family protein [Bacteroidales bacterium]|nr:cyclase family protein [Bacteroidales bacterium]